MKKIFTLAANIVMCLAANAQVMQVYKGDILVKEYSFSEADKVGFTSTPADDYEYVDLGLSVKWATYNVGAEHCYDYGEYYAWGEIKIKDEFTWGTYTYPNIAKYNSKYSTFAPEDDVAHAKWQREWRMPTESEVQELIDKCLWTWYASGNTEFKGVAGYKVQSLIADYTDKYIFLPAAGYRDGASLYGAGSYGGYWSSSLLTSYSSRACELYFTSSNVYGSYDRRYFGQSVRPVCP